MTKRSAIPMLALLVISTVLPLAIADGADDDALAPSPNLEILDPRVINATFTRRVPIIDGELSPNEWTTAGTSSALFSAMPPAWQETGVNISGEGIVSDEDASHLIYAMYDEEYLYLAFNCTDDNISLPTYPSEFWTSDGIEVCLDGALDKDTDQRTVEGFQDGDALYVPADGRDGIAWSLQSGNPYFRGWGRNDAWFSVSANRTGYYIVELELRLSSIMSPGPTSTIGFNTGQADNDDDSPQVEGRLRWQGADGVDMATHEPAWGRMYLRTFIEADAGIPQDVAQGATVTLDATASRHNHPQFGTVGTYTWTFVYGGTERTLSGATPTFVFDIPGEYLILLNVTDGTGVFSTDTVRVGVRDTVAPVVDAGPDVTLQQGTLHTFDALGTTDNDPAFPAGANYTWTLVDGIVVRLYGPAPTYTFVNAGEFVVRLQVADAAGNKDEDTVTITVLDVEPPLAVVGADQTVPDRMQVTLDGSASTDNMGIARYVWTLDIRGTPVTITGATQTYTFPSPGVYRVNLTVYDYDENSDTASFIVTVLDTTPPVASAGVPVTVDEGTEVTLDGVMSYDNVAIVEWTWNISIGGTVIESLFGEEVRYTFTSPGLFDVTLQVYDAMGLTSSDTVQVRVDDRTNPTAEPGGDRTVDEDAPVQFTGTASTDNVGVVVWNWTIDRTGYPRVRRSGESFEYTFEEPGIYNVTLTVTDAAGNWDAAFATITVRDVTDPVAMPPPSLAINIGQSVVFDGGASSDNVRVVRWVWNYTYLGVPVEVEGVNVTRLFEAKGNYTVRLTVFDAAGNSASRTFYVEVIKPKARDEPGFGVAIAVVAAASMAAIASRSSRGRRT